MSNKENNTVSTLDREAWLTKSAEIMFAGLFADNNIPTPNKWRVSCGFPPNRKGGKVIGVCFPTGLSHSSTNEIFISPQIDDTLKALGILAHEMIHASDDCQSGHKGVFAKWARAIGLEGKLTATTESEELISYFENKIVSELGEYPHDQVDVNNVKKQGTRMIKIECGACGFTARASQKWIGQLQKDADCPCCNESQLNAQI